MPGLGSFLIIVGGVIFWLIVGVYLFYRFSAQEKKYAEEHKGSSSPQKAIIS